MGHSENLLMYRRITQILFMLFIFLMPVLNILRYDCHARELIVFGQVWSLGLKEGFYADPSVSGAAHVALHFFLRAILPWVLILSLFPLLGFLVGRFFCGWLCPEGFMFELVDSLSLKLLGRRSLYGSSPNDPEGKQGNRLVYGSVALMSAVIFPLMAGISLTGYFIAPKTVWYQIMSGHLSFGVKAGIFGVTLYMFVTSLLVRHTFCKYICAAGLMQTLFGWVSPLSLRLKTDTARMGECTDCRQCEKACFMGVMPRKNKRDVSCVNCGACITACHRELGQGRGLFQLGFGLKAASQEEREVCQDPGADSCYVLKSNSAAKIKT
jgi:polyferredoxin